MNNNFVNMKKIIPIVIISAVFIFIGSIAKAETTKTYINKNGSYSLRYPATWYFWGGNSFTPSGSSFSPKESMKKNTPYFNVGIGKENEINSLSLKYLKRGWATYIKNYVAILKKNHNIGDTTDGETASVSSSTYSLRGYTASAIIFKSTFYGKGKVVHVGSSKIILVTKDMKTVYAIEGAYTNTADSVHTVGQLPKNPYTTDFQNMVQSFRIK